AGKKLKIAAGETTIVSDVSPGDYLLKVTYNDGKTESGAVTVEGGKRAEASFTYKPGQTDGATQTAGAATVLPPVTVQRRPLPQASIKIDGNFNDWKNIPPIVVGSQNATDNMT